MKINSEKRCAICQTKNKQKKTKVCGDCIFVNDFITKWGRENLRSIVNTWLLDKQNIVIEKKENKEIYREHHEAHHEKKHCNSPDCSCHSRRHTVSNISFPTAPPYEKNC